MDAFYRHEETLLKVHNDMDEEWVVTSNRGHEYWFSVWSKDKRASLIRAIKETCERVKIPFCENDVVFTSSKVKA